MERNKARAAPQANPKPYEPTWESCPLLRNMLRPLTAHTLFDR